jgi:hypothetical protein
MMTLSAAVVEMAATRWHTPRVHRFVVISVSIDAPFTAVFIRYLQMPANPPGKLRAQVHNQLTKRYDGYRIGQPVLER